MLDREPVLDGITSLAESAEFKPGDRIKTLKGSLRGTVRKILKDGRIVWQPDTSETELTALPESLLQVKK